MRVLFISKNIPIPSKKENAIIFTIAEKLSAYIDIRFLYPNEWVPWGLHFLKKYRPFYQLQAWKHGVFDVTPMLYPRIPVKNYAFSLFNSLSHKHLNAFRQAQPFDLIHAHFVLPDAYFAYLYQQKMGIPYIISIRKSDILYIKQISKKSSDYKKMESCIRHASALLTLNLAQKQFIDKEFGVTCQIVPHGIEENVLQDTPSLTNNKLIKIVSVGSPLPSKNMDWVIESVKSYQGQRAIQLDVVGGGTQLKQYEQNTTNLSIKIHDRIPRKQVIELMQKSHIFALPSSSETFGLVYLEAAACHNAIIGYEKQGVWGVFESHEMLFSKNKYDFTNLLHQLIDNPSKRQQLAKAAFAKAQQLTWKHIVQQYLDVYKKVSLQIT